MCHFQQTLHSCCLRRSFRFRDGHGNTQLTWYGHAAFKMVTPAGNVLLIDPWLTNPNFEKGKEELAGIETGRCDFADARPRRSRWQRGRNRKAHRSESSCPTYDLSRGDDKLVLGYAGETGGIATRLDIFGGHLRSASAGM